MICKPSLVGVGTTVTHNHRVPRDGCPPPAPTECRVQTSRAMLLKDSFTAQLIAEAPDRGVTASAAHLTHRLPVQK